MTHCKLTLPEKFANGKLELMADSLTLRAWLDASGISDAEFARKVKISKSHLSLIVGGHRGASLALALQIEKATAGAVSPSTLAARPPPSTNAEAAE